MRGKKDPAEADTFYLESSADHLTITANSIPAANTGINWYLKYYCHRTISHTGDNVEPVTALPEIKDSLMIRSPYRYRYALNYCTINYTMSFWDWDRWEKELDWMALNGVNLLLAPIGNEMVWYHVIRDLGFADSIAQRYAPGPAFTAWWLMGNLEGWGGPLPIDFMQRQVGLQKKIIARCNELGIETVVQGFYGVVPTFFIDHFPGAHFIEQGKWEGGFQRPILLDPADPLFDRVSRLYYEHFRTMYGSGFKYFGGDPFHEGGATGGLDLAHSAQLLYNAVERYYPDATWVLQAWQGNPKPQLLEGFGKGHTLILDLFGESDNYWEQTKGHNGNPWVWCVINNFGEKTGMWGKLQHFTSEPVRAMESDYGESLKGIGIMPEGINNNAVVYDLVLEMGWRSAPVDLKKWIKNFASYRYGLQDEHLEKGWEYLLQTVYSTNDSFNILGPVESIFLARPSLNVQSVSTWGVTKIYFDPAILKEAVREFLEAAPSCLSKPTFRYDLVDMCRQLISANGIKVYDELISSYKKGDTKRLKRGKDLFLKMILQEDSVCSIDKRFTLARWLDEAKARAANTAEKKQFVHNAKVQISYWGPDNPNSSLIDYANKEWSGMLKTYYYQRWIPFLDSLVKRAEERNNANMNEPAIDYFNMELNWAKDSSDYKTNIKVEDEVAWLKRVMAAY